MKNTTIPTTKRTTAICHLCRDIFNWYAFNGQHSIQILFVKTYMNFRLGSLEQKIQQ